MLIGHIREQKVYFVYSIADSLMGYIFRLWFLILYSTIVDLLLLQEHVGQIEWHYLLCFLWFFLQISSSEGGPRLLSLYSDSLWDGRFGDKIPGGGGVIFSAPNQTGLATYPAYNKMGTGPRYWGVKRPTLN
jgi:hypothetical protein